MVASLLQVPVSANLSPPEAEQDAIELSIVMPCLNEARTVGRCIDKAQGCLGRLGIKGEVVVADNGSTDGSQEIARSRSARVVHVERKGYGSALQAGIAAARGQYIIMGDADDSYDFANLESFILRLRQGDELVMGNRFKGGILPGAMPWLHRYVGNPVLSGILNFFFHTGIRDAHCGLRAFRKAAYERLGLATPGMEFASEMVVKASLHHQQISEVPVMLHPDGRDRPPHLRSFRDGWRHLRFLLLMCPLWLYLFPALLLLAGGVVTMAAAHASGSGIGSMLLGTTAAILGFQVLWIWVFSRTYGFLAGLLPAGTFWLRVLDYLTLEAGAVSGGVLVLSGIGLVALATISSLHFVFWGFLALSFGIHTVFSSFFLSMLRMPRK